MDISSLLLVMRWLFWTSLSFPSPSAFSSSFSGAQISSVSSCLVFFQDLIFLRLRPTKDQTSQNPSIEKVEEPIIFNLNLLFSHKLHFEQFFFPPLLLAPRSTLLLFPFGKKEQASQGCQHCIKSYNKTKYKPSYQNWMRPPHGGKGLQVQTKESETPHNSHC